MPAEIEAVYFDFDWDKRRVWSLDVPVESIDRARLEWHLDLPFWSSRPPEPLFDLRPRAVLDDPAVHAIHAERVRTADLRFPMDAMAHGSRLCLLDGMHRLVRHVQQGHRRVSVRIVPRSMIPHIARQ